MSFGEFAAGIRLFVPPGLLTAYAPGRLTLSNIRLPRQRSQPLATPCAGMR